MRTRRRPARDLRVAIDCLPLQTRKAMLDGMDCNRIIVGAYTDRSGGVCPMLAAHRNGGRTNLASFAHAWDRYTRARRARPATEYELRALRAMLEASVTLDETPSLADVPRPRRPPPADTGERHRGAELSGRAGWAWLRPFRRLDEYERALAQLEQAERERELERV